MTRQILLSLFYIFLFTPHVLMAETIRGPIAWEIILPDEVSPRQIAVQASQLLLLKTGENTRFLKGVLLEITLSETMKRYADSFAMEVYSGIRKTGDQEYTGSKILFEVMPFLSKVYLSIPVKKRENPATGMPGTFTPRTPLSLEDFPVVFSIQPIMKGVPDSVLGKSFLARSPTSRATTMTALFRI